MLTDEFGEGKTLDDLCLLRRHFCVSDETEASKLWWKETAEVEQISDLSVEDPGNGAHCAGIERTGVINDLSDYLCVCLSVCLSVCLKPKSDQLFCLFCLNIRGSAKRTCNKDTLLDDSIYCKLYLHLPCALFEE